MKTSPFLEDFMGRYRKKVKFIEEDKVMYEDIESSIYFLREVELNLPELYRYGF
jgi:histidine ammonia-lyase